MLSQLIVEDGFYRDPTGPRAFALSQNYRVKGNYPGFRTQGFATSETKHYLQRVIGREITGFVMRPDHYNGAYQYTTASMRSWIHRDKTEWAGIVYLTPDAPLSAGTGFFQHKATGISELPRNAPETVSKLLNRDSSDLTKWDMIDRVGNLYNRLLCFRGFRSHMSLDYFGQDLYDGRLMQVFFFGTNSRGRVQVPRTEPDVTMEPTPIPESAPDKPRKVAVLFFTTSRYQYLDKMLFTFEQYVDFGGVEVRKILIDDYPQGRDVAHLESLRDQYGFELVMNDENLGYAHSWGKAWEMIKEDKDIDFVWHQEEDFIFTKPIEVSDVIEAMETSPVPLTQMVMKRQPWFPNNDWIVEVEEGRGGKEVQYGDRRMVISQRFFNANPSLYPRWVVEEEYPHAPQETIGHILSQRYPERYSAFYGGRRDAPLCTHIGEVTQGFRHDDKDPAAARFAHFDPDKKYMSRTGREVIDVA